MTTAAENLVEGREESRRVCSQRAGISGREKKKKEKGQRQVRLIECLCSIFRGLWDGR